MTSRYDEDEDYREQHSSLAERVDTLQKRMKEYQYRLRETQAELELWNKQKLIHLSDEENLGLPIPRVEMRYIYDEKRNVLSGYIGIVTRSMMKKLELKPFNVTEFDGKGEEYTSFEYEGSAAFGDLRNLMYETKFPGFLVFENNYEEVDVDITDGNTPDALTRKIQEDKKEEVRAHMTDSFKQKKTKRKK